LFRVILRAMQVPGRSGRRHGQQPQRAACRLAVPRRHALPMALFEGGSGLVGVLGQINQGSVRFLLV